MNVWDVPRRFLVADRSPLTFPLASLQRHRNEVDRLRGELAAFKSILSSGPASLRLAMEAGGALAGAGPAALAGFGAIGVGAAGALPQLALPSLPLPLPAPMPRRGPASSSLLDLAAAASQHAQQPLQHGDGAGSGAGGGDGAFKLNTGAAAAAAAAMAARMLQQGQGQSLGPPAHAAALGAVPTLPAKHIQAALGLYFLDLQTFAQTSKLEYLPADGECSKCVHELMSV